MTNDIVVRRVKLPSGVKGCVTTSPDGWNNIYINDALSPQQQREVLEHELGHVENDDLGGERDFVEAENKGSSTATKKKPNIIFASMGKGTRCQDIHPDDIRDIEEIVRRRRA